MKNPFPGMNPFIEGYKWPPFHVSFLVKIQEILIKKISQRYLLEIEETSFFESGQVHSFAESPIDINGLPRGEGHSYSFRTPPTKRRSVQEVKVRSLHVIDAKSLQLVTSIELLSPTNKRGNGLVRYRAKRQRLIDTGINLVEIDLLRGGKRPDRKTTSTSPYLMQVFRAFQGDILEWSVGLFDKLPTVPVPLLSEHPPLVLDLQAVFDKTFRLSSLPRALKYDLAQLQPTIKETTDLAQVEEYLKAAE